MAEGLIRNILDREGLNWEIDSAGTESYHVGELPDKRAISTCAKFNIDITVQRARRITFQDFSHFDIVYAMAGDVLEEIQFFLRGRTVKAEVKLLMDEVYPGKKQSVPDPWYGSEEGFLPVYKMIESACETIVKKYHNKRESVITG